MFYTGRRRARSIRSCLRCEAAKSGPSAERREVMNGPFNVGEDAQARIRARVSQTIYPASESHADRRPTPRGRAALEQARLIMLVMINVAQLWILAATVEASLARNYQELWPL